jgi:hypothetical protein
VKIAPFMTRFVLRSVEMILGQRLALGMGWDGMG